MKLSVIIPCYNEARTLERLVNQVIEQKDLIKEIIIVDDKSIDSSADIIKKLSENNSLIKFFFKDVNEGKGSAIKKGIELATGEIILIQDADLEYDPSEYLKLIKPFKISNADVVYGSRFLGGDYVRLHFFWHYLANKILTFLCNIVTNLNMSDMETGYKLIKRDHLKSIVLKEKSFGIEIELLLKIVGKNAKIYEVNVDYDARTIEDGKKIRFKDALRAIYCLLRY